MRNDKRDWTIECKLSKEGFFLFSLELNWFLFALITWAKWCRGFLLTVPSFSLHLYRLHPVHPSYPPLPPTLSTFSTQSSVDVSINSPRRFCHHTFLRQVVPPVEKCVKLHLVSYPTLQEVVWRSCSAARAWSSAVDGRQLSTLSGSVPAVSRDIF